VHVHLKCRDANIVHGKFICKTLAKSIPHLEAAGWDLGHGSSPGTAYPIVTIKRPHTIYISIANVAFCSDQVTAFPRIANVLFFPKRLTAFPSQDCRIVNVSLVARFLILATSTEHATSVALRIVVATAADV
jgi:hypothetical protein